MADKLRGGSTVGGNLIWHAGNFGNSITLNGDITGSAILTTSGVITLTTTIATNSVALGTDTTGNYVANLVAGTGISVGGAAEGGTPTITNTSPNIVQTTITGNAATATALATARSITLSGDVTGTATYNGTATTTITTVVANDSHTHGDSTINGLDATAITTGTLSRPTSSSSASCTGNAATASQLYINNDDTGDTNCPILFTANSTAGNKAVYEDSLIYVDNTNNNIHATGFTGALTGNATSATTLVSLTSTVTELNKLDGYTGTATELNWMDTLHATGVTSTEFDYLDGVTSNIQTQLNGKLSTTGKAADSDKLDGVDSTSFLRSDATDTFTSLSGTSLTISGVATGAITTDNDVNFNLAVTNYFKSTPTAGFTLTFTNFTAGRSGIIILDNSGAWTPAKAANVKADADFLTTIAVAGVYQLGYIADGTNVYVTYSKALV